MKKTIRADLLLDDLQKQLDPQTFEMIEGIIKIHQGAKLYKCEVRPNWDFSLCPNDPMNKVLFTGYVVTGNKAMVRKLFKKKYPRIFIDWYRRKEVVDWNNEFFKHELLIDVEEVRRYA